MVEDGITIRQATVADVDDLVQLRRMMFEAMGFDDPAKLDAGDAAASAYFARAIPGGEFQGWLAVTPDGEPVSTCGLVIDQHPPGPGNLSGKTGYIMNVVTHPAYRRRSLARRLVQATLAWLSEHDVQRAELHATDMGRPLYEELGFAAHTGMRLEMRE
jgi:ribosomal protein S18 acetylase RimI-like enzyme